MNADIHTSFIVIRTCDPQRNMAWFYALSVPCNLFGSWSFVREWGRIGRPGTMKIELCDSFEHAVDAFHVKFRQPQKRGYI
jgi:predicted DNA-binding WGR domain protein